MACKIFILILIFQVRPKYWKYLFDKDYNIKGDGYLIKVKSRDDFGMELVESDVDDNNQTECSVDVKHVNVYKLWELMQTSMNNIQKVPTKDVIISIGAFLKRASSLKAWSEGPNMCGCHVVVMR